ncbi:MAG: DUF262 domain-containing protein [Chitinophagales bacterium]|nr:DUF262 domain-containing protein [Chitinophagales bacterium]
MNIDHLIKKFNNAQESLVIQQSDFSLETLSRMVINNIVDLNPHYQRRNRWTVDKQSKLIESFILNVPVPPIYFSEDEYGVYSVIDGKQRLTSIHDFLFDAYKLKNLEVFSELNGLTYSELPNQIKHALSIRPYIRIVTLLKQSDPHLKYEVFLRLNTGGDALKAQEIRNVAFDGSLNALLYELSSNEILKQKLKITDDSSNAFRKMEDLEMILRFFALLKFWDNLPNQNISKVLDIYMQENRNPNRSEIQHLRDLFNNSIQICDELLQGNAFYKPTSQTIFREQLIAPLYDAQLIAVAILINEGHLNQLRQIDQTKLRIRLYDLFQNNEQFIKSVTQATNNASNVNTRIRTMYDLLNSLL